MRGVLYLGVVLLAATVAVGCSGAADEGLSVEVSLDSMARSALPVRVDIHLVESCDSVTLGSPPDEALASTFALRDGTTGPGLQNVPPGNYGLYVLARDASCFVVGAQCDAVTIEAEGSGALAITVGGFAGQGCAVDEQCDSGSGQCVSFGDPVEDCSAEPDETPCIASETTGQCRMGECCTGCWDGSTCHAGDQNVRCGIGGGICALCECSTDICDVGSCSPSTPFAEVDMGVDHTCAIDEEGQLWCWGARGAGQLGIGSSQGSSCDTDACTVPTELAVRGSGPTWAQVSAGESVTCAISATDSSLWCWGTNDDGRMGAASDVLGADEPMLVSPAVHAKVDTEDGGGCALRASDSSLWCWGENLWGQAGLGSTGSDVFGPTKVPYGATWDDFSVGDQFTFAIGEAEFWAWGYDSDGQLGTGVTGGATHPALTGFVGSAVEAGNDTTCALDLLGVAHCWGENRYGQVGNGDATGAAVTTPSPVLGDHSFDHFALGGSSACAVTTDGALYCWGNNRYEQLGVGQPYGMLPLTTEPMRVGIDSSWATVTAGGDSACALRDDGSLWCWGRNHRGQLGLGDTDSRLFPTRVCF